MNIRVDLRVNTACVKDGGFMGKKKDHRWITKLHLRKASL